MIPWRSHIHLCISSLPLPLFLPFLPPSLVIPSAIFSAHDEGIYPYESGKLRPRQTSGMDIADGLGDVFTGLVRAVKLAWRNVEETGDSLQTAPTNVLFHCSVWWWKACVGSETFLPLCCSSTGVIQWSTERTVLSLVRTTIHIAILIKLGRYDRTPQPSHRSSTKPSLFMNESSLRRQDIKCTSPRAEFRVTHELKKQGSFMCGARWLEVRKSEEMGGLHMHDPTPWFITGHVFRKRWH